MDGVRTLHVEDIEKKYIKKITTTTDLLDLHPFQHAILKKTLTRPCFETEVPDGKSEASAGSKWLQISCVVLKRLAAFGLAKLLTREPIVYLSLLSVTWLHMNSQRLFCVASLSLSMSASTVVDLLMISCPAKFMAFTVL